jgi:hypothetical protein
VYAREIEGYPEPLTFGVSGKLIMNVLVMFDWQTGTFWSQLLGQAVEGELAGTRLEPIAATQTTWVHWKRLHPNTVALSKGHAGSPDPYLEYYSSREAGVIGETRRDDRLDPKALGIGLVVNDQPAYYPFIHLARERVVNDTVAGEPLLIVFQPDVATALVFKRQVDDRTLTFEAENTDADQFILRDAETSSRWLAWTGGVLDGPLDGTLLERVPATTAFWFGWKDWHPDTYLYGSSAAE